MRTQLAPEDTRDGLTYVLGVRKADTGDTYEAGCSCGFTSSNWPLKKHAEERLEGHAEEHVTGEPATELYEFELAAGLVEPVATRDPFRGLD